MIGFLKFLKPKIKYLLALSLVSAILSQFIAPIASTRADGPAFNFLPGDKELFRGLNQTAGETVFKDPVVGSAGNVFEGLIYYHNGVLNTTAVNTRVRLTIPVSTINGAATLSASISADNAATISNTVVNDQIVGQPGLTINLDQDADLALVPGSVRWFPDANVRGTDTPAVLPFGQSGDEIISASGLNIDGIEGCWNFAGFVQFSFRTVPKVALAASLTLEKSVRNITKAETNFSENTVASINDIVEFNLAVGNNGNVAINNAIIRDALPAELSMVPGSMTDTVTPKSDTELNQLLGSGWPTGRILNPAESLNIRFQAKSNANTSAEKTVTNTAFVTAGAINLSDIATVTLKPAANIEKAKKAHNNTTNTDAALATVDGRNVLALEAHAGDEIVYTLTTKNSGGSSVDIVVSDDITDILKEADLTSASNGGIITNASGIRSITYPSAAIDAGQTLDRTFTIRIKDTLPPLSDEIDDKLSNIYGNEVLVTVSRPTPPVPNLHIEKLVRNFTINAPDFVKSNTAYAGDVLEYRINFSNDGSGPSDQVKFSDVLPPNTQYLAGTTAISKNGNPEQTLLDGLTGAGITLDQIAANESGYIKFRVATSNKIAPGEVLTNVAFLTHREETLSANAETTIKPVAIVPEVKIPMAKLPVTGAAASGSFVLTFALGLLFMYIKYRQTIVERSEFNRIACDIISL